MMTHEANLSQLSQRPSHFSPSDNEFQQTNSTAAYHCYVLVIIPRVRFFIFVGVA